MKVLLVKLRILPSVLILNAIFIFIYEFLLKKELMNIINHKVDPIDVIYYNNIFANLTSSGIIVEVLLLFIFYNRNQIKTWINLLSNSPYLIWYFIGMNILVQFLIFMEIQTIPISDSIYYIELADRILKTGSYISPNGYFTAFWPVGLPMFIALLMFLFKSWLIWFKLFNIAISSASLYVLYNIFKKYLTQKQLVLFLLIFTFYPNNLFSVNIVMTDFPFTFLLWCVIWLLSETKRQSGIGIGVLLALICYLRASALFLPIIIFLFLLNYLTIKQSLLRILIISSFMLLILSPWIYRNYTVFEKLIPVSTNGGFNFLMGNHHDASGGLNFDFKYNADNPYEYEEDKLAYKTAFNEIINNPLQSLIRIPKKILISYLRGDSSITWSLKMSSNKIPPLLVSLVFFVTNFMFYLVVIGSLLQLVRRKNFESARDFHILLFLVLSYFLLLVMIYVGGERYIIPIIPIHFYYFAKNLT